MAVARMYESSVYNRLPQLAEAYQEFSSRNPLEIIEHEISELFLKHNVYEELSVSLIHRHFSMDSHEKLVEFGSVSTPWPIPHDGSSLVAEGQIIPRSWIFINGQLMPYEFGYNDASKENQYKELPNKPQFYRELNSLLEKHHLTDLLGLQLNTDITRDGFVKFEKTFNRSNVVFTVKKDGKSAQKDTTSAQWMYKPLGDIIVPVKKLVCFVGCVCGSGSVN